MVRLARTSGISIVFLFATIAGGCGEPGEMGGLSAAGGPQRAAASGSLGTCVIYCTHQFFSGDGVTQGSHLLPNNQRCDVSQLPAAYQWTNTAGTHTWVHGWAGRTTAAQCTSWGNNTTRTSIPVVNLSLAPVTGSPVWYRFDAEATPARDPLACNIDRYWGSGRAEEQAATYAITGVVLTRSGDSCLTAAGLETSCLRYGEGGSSVGGCFECTEAGWASGRNCSMAARAGYAPPSTSTAATNTSTSYGSCPAGAASDTGCFVTVGGTFNVRSCPEVSDRCAPLGQVSPGTQLAVRGLRSGGGWWLVAYGGSCGWIFGGGASVSATPASACNGVPVIAP